MRTMQIKAEYEEYLEQLDEGETPMTLDQFIANMACEEDYRRATREP